MTQKNVVSFLQELDDAFNKNQFVKLILGNKRKPNEELKSVLIKPILLKDKMLLNVVYRNNTNEISKNFSIHDALRLIEKMLAENFYNADLFTATHTIQLIISKDEKVKMTRKLLATNLSIDLNHDHQKNRLVSVEKNNYLFHLGITNQDGFVRKDKQAKYKQINRYVEIVADILKNIVIEKPWQVADMGCGKAYLTFALCDYLNKNYPEKFMMTGVEMRLDLVTQCNKIAQQNCFQNLQFIEASIQNFDAQNINMLIALHACDTATDDAIKKGVAASAQLIICAPCCHKQVRNAMKPQGIAKSITQHGILFERQAEILTDTIRALWLESKGYKTRVFDFIDWGDTPKNVLIVAQKADSNDAKKQECLLKIQELKKFFGLQEHYLEKEI